MTRDRHFSGYLFDPKRGGQRSKLVSFVLPKSICMIHVSEVKSNAGSKNFKDLDVSLTVQKILYDFVRFLLIPSEQLEIRRNP